jgi:hypothetical protein
VHSVAAANSLRLPDAAAALVIGEAARMVGDAERLSLNFGAIGDLLREADFRAEAAGRERVGPEDIGETIDERTFRADRLRERWHERIGRDIVLIDTEGTRTGQGNGLSVMETGGFMFGAPARITARVRMGGGLVIDIEREAKLGGPIHSKGVLILRATWPRCPLGTCRRLRACRRGGRSGERSPRRWPEQPPAVPGRPCSPVWTAWPIVHAPTTEWKINSRKPVTTRSTPASNQARRQPCAAAALQMLYAASPPPRRPTANSTSISGTTMSTSPAR